jgi:Hint domain
MQKIRAHLGTRRQLFRGIFRVIASGAASVPLIAFPKKSSSQTLQWHWRRPIHCLLKGTNISTPSGDRRVQDLKIGDEVHTVSGSQKIKWIGYNKFTKEVSKTWQETVEPIRVARFAIDDHSPRRELYVSPLHCIFVDNALIPAKYLINGSTVAPGMPADMSAVEYYHIEFDAHEVIYAEGALVESFFDGDSGREYFSNFVQYERLYGAERQLKMRPFAPILGYRNRRERVRGLARSVISNVVDVRDPIQIVHDQIAKRAEALLVR